MDRDFIWEADYGERRKVYDVSKKLLTTQKAESLQCISYFVNNNPYNLEFYILVSYNTPTEEEMVYMKQNFENIGLKYRNDVTMDTLFCEMKNRRFNSVAFCDEKEFDRDVEGLFWFPERRKLEKMGYIMKSFTINKEIFISHASENKDRIRKLIPYLNGKNMAVWFDEYNINGGDRLYDRIKSGMEEATVIVFWVSKGFLKSNWCREEMKIAADMKLKQIYIIDEDVDFKELKKDNLDYKYIIIKQSDTIELIARKILDCIEKNMVCMDSKAHI